MGELYRCQVDYEVVLMARFGAPVSGGKVAKIAGTPLPEG
jgi:hypothetical protein